jgi:hypothetical protein
LGTTPQTTSQKVSLQHLSTSINNLPRIVFTNITHWNMKPPVLKCEIELRNVISSALPLTHHSPP